jgi:protein involved in polysaccharide export with SLBB domain
VAINQTEIKTSAQLRSAMYRLDFGDDLRIRVYRDSGYLTLYAVVK